MGYWGFSYAVSLVPWLCFVLSQKKRGILLPALAHFIVSLGIFLLLQAAAGGSGMGFLNTLVSLLLYCLGFRTAGRSSWPRSAYEAIWCTALSRMGLQLACLAASIVGSAYNYRDLALAKLAVYAMMIPLFLLLGKRVVCMEEGLITRELVLLSAVTSIPILLFNDLIFFIVQERTYLVYLLLTFSTMVILISLYLERMIFQEKKSQMEAQVMENLWRMQQEQFLRQREAVRLINRKCHDLKHQILALQRMDSEERSERLMDLMENVQMYDERVRTGNGALDTLLMEKKLHYAGEGVELECLIDGRPLGFLDVTDLFVLLGNALDNAFESLMKEETPGERVISLRGFRRGRLYHLEVENELSGTLCFENGLPVSSRAADGFHGYGTKSIRAIAEKYQGAADFQVVGNVFRLRVMLPLPAQP